LFLGVVRLGQDHFELLFVMAYDERLS